jgi:DNA-binding CsgD family transcriptional regulator
MSDTDGGDRMAHRSRLAPPPGRPAGSPHLLMSTPHPSLNYDAATLGRALDEVPVPAYVLDGDGRFRWLNHAATALLGSALGRPFARVVAPEDVHSARVALARNLLGEPKTDLPLTLIDGRGGRVRVRIASVPLWEDQLVIAVFGLATVDGVGRERRVAEAMNARARGLLTGRQFEALILLAEGHGTRCVAARMGIAYDTARNHIRGLLRALNVHSRLQAVARARELGLIPKSSEE